MTSPKPTSTTTRRCGLAALLSLIALAIAMATATIIGTKGGQGEADRAVYSTVWFSLLWAMAAVSGSIYLLLRRERRAPVLLLHAALGVILLGALLTRVASHRGRVHLRVASTATDYTLADGSARKLPFTLRLDRFSMPLHDGTGEASDYQSHLTITAAGQQERALVAMNRIYHGHGVRLYQSGCDADGMGTTLSVSEDDWGTGVSYTGYALLLASLLWTLGAPRGRFRQLLRRAQDGGWQHRAAVVALLLCMGCGARAQRVLPADVAEVAGRTLIVHNGRVCPLETFAIDFTRKLHGARSYKGLTPCQVLTGAMLFPDDWLREPFLRVKGRQLRDKLGMDKEFAAPEELLSGGYRLGPMLRGAQGRSDKLSTQVLDMDDRLMLLMQVMRMEGLRMFPYPTHSGAPGKWLAPTEQQPRAMAEAQRRYVADIIPMASMLAQQGRYDLVRDAFERIGQYQRRYGGASVPPAWRLRAEHAYNAANMADYLYIAYFAIALLSALLIARRRMQGWPFALLPLLPWLALTAFLALRWAASGSVPMGNGYETMLLMAWIVTGMAAVLSRRAPVVVPLGMAAAGMLLLVAHLSQMDPAISQRMPVLQSPLLALHVSVVMAGYAFLAITFATSLAYLLLRYGARRPADDALLVQLKPLSELMLYPAVAALAIGIFLGAVWANVSWGSYWSWDPKETWALITLLVYSVPLHQQSVAALRRPETYHLYLLLAFASLAVTYFGVNYLMAGMHSYA